MQRARVCVCVSGHRTNQRNNNKCFCTKKNQAAEVSVNNNSNDARDGHERDINIV